MRSFMQHRKLHARHYNQPHTGIMSADKLATVVLCCVLLGVVLFLTVWTTVRTAKGLHVTPHLPNFPIDVVCTWVDGNDKSWRSHARFQYHLERTRNPNSGQVHDRFREPTPLPPSGRDELFYNVVGVLRFMPWIRKYFLVTQRPHRPVWWPASGRMAGIQFVLVHHDDIFEDQDLLPNFSTNTIHRYIGNIKGLAERFVLFDDDVFVARPMQPCHFFTPSGRPVVNVKPAVLRMYPAGNWKQQLLNLQDRLRVDLQDDSFMVHVTEHVCIPLLKSVYQYAALGRFSSQSRGFKRFRCVFDYPVPYAAVNLQLARKLSVPQKPDVKTGFSFGGDLKLVNGMLPHMFCVNDFLAPSDRKILDDWYTVR